MSNQFALCQRSIGNSPLRAVRRPQPVLQRKCACGGTPGPTGECQECKRKRLALQTKLAVNQPGDQYEQEADRVAEAVVRGAAASRSSINSLGSNAAQRERQAAVGKEVSGTPPIVDDVLQSSGQPLEGATRAVMEERFGFDFSRVRIHCDQEAGQSAQAVSADAYTVGHHVVFAPDRYGPGTSAGQQLLAHELVHVVQQSAAAGPAISDVDSPESPPEQAAEGATKGILSGGMPPPQRSVASPRIQRQAAAGSATPPASSPCRIHFRKGTTEFTNAKEFARCMEAIRAYLKGAGATKIVELHGYASEEGTADFNQELSDKRAKIVKLLLGKGGIDSSRLKLSAHGGDKSYPKLDENRRVEILLDSPKKPPSTDFPGPPPVETLKKLYNLAPVPGPSDKEAEPELAKPKYDTRDCSEEFMRSHVWPGDRLARRMAYFATRGLSSQDAAMERMAPEYFGSSWRDHRDTIVQKFNQIYLALEKGGFVYECEQDCEAETWGYVRVINPFVTIHLCENTLKTGMNVEGMAATIIHEMSHEFAGTDDPEGKCTDICNTSDTKRAVNTAACYGKFAKQAYLSKEAETRRRK